MSKVYIVIVNYKGYLDTIECLESVLKLDFNQLKVIVVINSETPTCLSELINWCNGSKLNIITKFPEIVLPPVSKPIPFKCYNYTDLTQDEPIESLSFIECSNRGFAAANNVALKFLCQNRAEFEYVWFLNNDTIVEKESLTHLFSDASISGKKTGIIGSKLKLYHDPSKIQGVGGHYNKWFGMAHEIGFQQMDSWKWNSAPKKIDYVIGASMFVSRDFIEEVGFMNEDLFLYYEELDWALRGKTKGFNLSYCPKSIVYHKMGASINADVTRGNSEIADYYSVRNRILIAKKYFPITLVTLYPAFLKFIFNRIKLRQFARIKMFLKILQRPTKHYKEYAAKR